jgi:hypothetical protein
MPRKVEQAHRKSGVDQGLHQRPLQAGMFEIAMKQMHHGTRLIGWIETLCEQTLSMPNKGFDAMTRRQGRQAVLQTVSGPRCMARIIETLT